MSAGNFSDNTPLEAQKHFMPFKGRELGGARDPPPWLHCDLPSVLKTKGSVPEMEKQTMPLENYKGTPRACRDAVRKPEAQFKLKLARDVKNRIEGCFRYVNTK